MTEYADHASILVADVDCTAGGKPLCDTNGVKGFPTLKYGDPSSLEDYEGGRDETALKKFVSELKHVCSPANMDLCDAEGKVTHTTSNTRIHKIVHIHTQTNTGGP